MEPTDEPIADSALTRRRALQLLAGAAGAISTGLGFASTPTLARAKQPLDAAGTVDWNKLSDDLQGKFVPQSDAAYETKRRALVWNARKPEQFPAAIVHVAGEDDVRTAVNFARKHRLKVAIRGGGHSWNGTSLRQGSLLLDLSRLREIHVDVAKRELAIQPAITGREVVELLTPHGLAFPVGHCPTVPLSGYLLNGGFGWNSGAWGPACASLRSIEMIDARGESITASADRNADLFWAARGAGPGFFGVVTRYHLTVHPLPAVIRTSTLSYRARDVDAVAPWLAEIVAGLPPQVEVVCAFVSPPPGPVEPPPEPSAAAPPAAAGTKAATGATSAAAVNPPVRRVLMIAATSFAATAAEAERWLAPFATGPKGRRPLVTSHLQDSSFDTLLGSMDGLFPMKQRYAADVAWSNSALPVLLPILRDQALAAPSSRTFVLAAPVSPRPAGAPVLPDMALSMFGSTYVATYGVWSEPAQDAGHKAWVRAAGTALRAHTVGRYVGEADLLAGADRARECYTPAAWARLVELKQQYDPEDVFCSYPTPG